MLACGSRPPGRCLLLVFPSSPRLRVPAMSDSSRSARRHPPLPSRREGTIGAVRQTRDRPGASGWSLRGRSGTPASSSARHAPGFAARGTQRAAVASAGAGARCRRLADGAPLPRLHRSAADRAKRLRGVAQAASSRSISKRLRSCRPSRSPRRAAAAAGETAAPKRRPPRPLRRRRSRTGSPPSRPRHGTGFGGIEAGDAPGLAPVRRRSMPAVVAPVIVRRP